MLILSSRQFSLIFSIIATFIVAAVLYFSTGLFWLLLLPFITFFLFYFFVHIISEKLIYRRILTGIQYYRNLKNGGQKRIAYADNLLEKIFSELEGWADDRKNEIEQLKKLELYRKEYIGNISHELKTPIFNIQGYVLTLLDGAFEDKNVNRDYLIRAEKSVERMISMVEDLESISQLETGELSLEQDRFDIVALAKEVVETQEMNATAKGIILSVKTLNANSLFVLADKFKIRQVLTNLIVNSIKYGREYGETIVKFYERGENIVIEIADNGIGIAEEHLPRIFERFYRVDKSRSRDQGGTGLGLSIVKHIIEAHNQNISVASKAGEGTVFTFTLKSVMNMPASLSV